MTFDLSLILAYLQQPGPQNAAAIASFTSFFLDLRNFFAEKAKAEETATIDDYLEWLRRTDQAELVRLITANRDSCERGFATVQQVIRREFDQVHGKIDQLRSDLADMGVNPAKIRIIRLTEWMEESVVMTDNSLHNTALCTKLSVVNTNHTELTIRTVVATLVRGSEAHNVKHRRDKITIPGGGASAELDLITVNKIMYRRGDKLTLSDISLKCDQCEHMLAFRLQEGVYVPTEKA